MHHYVAALALVLAAAPAVAQTPVADLWGTDRMVRAAAIAADTLYVGGDFVYVGPPTGQLAVLDRITGEPDFSWPKFGGNVYAIEPDGSGGFFIGGSFRFAGGREQHNLAHILPGGTLNEGFQPDPVREHPNEQGDIRSLVVHDGVLYAGGWFDHVAGESRRNLAAFDLATGQLLPFDANMSFLSPVGTVSRTRDLAVHANILFVCGGFTSLGGENRNAIAALHTTTHELLPWNPDLDHACTAVAPSDDAIYFGGVFQYVGGQQRRRYAAVSPPGPDGTGVLLPWNPAGTSSQLGQPYDMVAHGAYVYAAGYMGSGANLNGFVRIQKESGAWALFGQGAAIRGGGRILIDGPLAYLAGSRHHPEGGFEIALVQVELESGAPTGYTVIGGDPRGSAGISFVYAIGLTDTSVVLGGEFTSMGGEHRRFLAGIDLTTGRPVELDPRPFSSVEYMTASPDGRFLYWITFNGIGATDLHTGESWTYWQPSNAAERDAFRATLETAEDGAVNQEGPLFADGDWPYVPPAEAAAPRAEVPRVRGGQRWMVATDDRLYVGGWAFERLTAETMWQTPITVVAGQPLGEVTLFGKGGPGGQGDTLILSGDILSAGGQTRHDLVALDAETGAVLDWYPGPTYNTAGIYGITLVDDTLYVGGAQLWEFNGLPRQNVAAVDVHTAEILPWAPGVVGGTHANPEVWTVDHHDGVLYLGGGFHQVNGQFQLRAAALDLTTGEKLDWTPYFQHFSGDVFPGVRTIIVSPEHERVYLTGSFMNSAKGAGHANVVGLSLVGAEPPVGTEPGALPERASLSAPFPNPARSSATVTLSLPRAAAVEVALYDVLGRRVAVMHEGALETGEHALTVDASRLAAGVYVVRAAGEGFSESKRITVVR